VRTVSLPFLLEAHASAEDLLFFSEGSKIFSRRLPEDPHPLNLRQVNLLGFHDPPESSVTDSVYEVPHLPLAGEQSVTFICPRKPAITLSHPNFLQHAFLVLSYTKGTGFPRSVGLSHVHLFAGIGMQSPEPQVSGLTLSCLCDSLDS